MKKCAEYENVASMIKCAEYKKNVLSMIKTFAGHHQVAWLQAYWNWSFGCVEFSSQSIGAKVYVLRKRSR